MYITRLSLRDFRNYEDEKIEFSPGVNIIYGANGMGKTNALEAIYYFSQGRGLRGLGREAIRYGCQEGKISLDFNRDGRDHSGEIIFEGRSKKIFLNEIELKKTSQLVGRFVCVLFTPDELSLVKGSPDVRRRFLDSSIIPLRPAYLSTLMSYNLILKQKIAVLRRGEYRMLPIFNQQLAQVGAGIIHMRRSYLESIREGAARVQTDISSGNEKLEIAYNSTVRPMEVRNETAKALLEKMETMEESEKENKICFVGPHRDDISFKLNGRSARSYASQGQQRSIVLSLKAAQTELVEKETGESPVMLLDDIMSELDKYRRDFLRERISGKQVVITCTEAEDIDLGAGNRSILIDNGKVVRD